MYIVWSVKWKSPRVESDREEGEAQRREREWWKIHIFSIHIRHRIASRNPTLESNSIIVYGFLSCSLCTALTTWFFIQSIPTVFALYSIATFRSRIEFSNFFPLLSYIHVIFFSSAAAETATMSRLICRKMLRESRPIVMEMMSLIWAFFAETLCCSSATAHLCHSWADFRLPRRPLRSDGKS